MGAFVDVSDFNNQPYNVPDTETTENSSFALFIIDKEEEQLTKILGYAMYKAFIDGLAVIPTIDPIWVSLRDGAEYIENPGPNAITYKYSGMKKLFIPFIYAMWLKSTFDSWTGSGVTIPKLENSDVLSPSLRISNAYNVHSRLVGKHHVKNSLHGFLAVNVANYPLLKFKSVGHMNFLGL